MIFLCREKMLGILRNSPFANMHWLYLAIAIFSEVVATSALKAADGFTRFLPSLLVVAGYGSSFYFLSLTLRFFPLGVVYAIWSGVGVSLVTLAGWVVYHQKLDTGALAGIVLIVAGVIVLNLFSRNVLH
jgi:small multidrug resistance pump